MKKLQVMIYVGYALSIIGIVLAFFHDRISGKPDDTTFKAIGVAVLVIGAGLRIYAQRKMKAENPM